MTINAFYSILNIQRCCVNQGLIDLVYFKWIVCLYALYQFNTVKIQIKEWKIDNLEGKLNIKKFIFSKCNVLENHTIKSFIYSFNRQIIRRDSRGQAVSFSMFTISYKEKCVTIIGLNLRVVHN